VISVVKFLIKMKKRLIIAGIIFIFLVITAATIFLFGYDTFRSSEGLIADLDSNYVRYRYNAAIELGGRRERAAVPKLIEVMLKDKNHLVREAAARSLVWIGDKKAYPAMIGGLKDPNVFIRRKAVAGIRKLGGKESVTVLENFLKIEKDPYVQIEIIEAIEVLGNKESIGVLKNFLRIKREPYIQKSVKKAIRELERRKPLKN
jgi:HEAT repeat protein